MTTEEIKKELKEKYKNIRRNKKDDVCEEWKNFENFFEWGLQRYTEGCSIRKINLGCLRALDGRDFNYKRRDVNKYVHSPRTTMFTCTDINYIYPSIDFSDIHIDPYSLTSLSELTGYDIDTVLNGFNCGGEYFVAALLKDKGLIRKFTCREFTGKYRGEYGTDYLNKETWYKTQFEGYYKSNLGRIKNIAGDILDYETDPSTGYQVVEINNIKIFVYLVDRIKETESED